MLNNKSKTYILAKPCGFCNRGYHCHDIDDNNSSYKHTFHPFCLRKFLKVNNKFSICAQLFHLDWWHSWGFWEEDEDVKMLVVDMRVDE
jgi:hypothetical protein